MVLGFRQSLLQGSGKAKIYICMCVCYPLRGDGQPLERLTQSSANRRFSLRLLYSPRARSSQSGFSPLTD